MLKQICKQFLTTRSITIVPFKNSQWSPSRLEPVVSKEQLDYIKENEPDRFTNLKYSKVKSLHPFRANNEFYDEFIFRLVGRVLRKGARERADKLIRETLFLIKKDRLEKCRELEPSERANFVRDPVQIMKQAWENCKPVLKILQVTRGGSKYFAPIPTLEHQKDKIVFSWVREVIENRPRPRPEKFPQVFSRELLLAYKNEGKLIKKKLDLYRLCEANKAYVNYIYMRSKPNQKK